MSDCGRQRQSEAIANKNDTSIKTIWFIVGQTVLRVDEVTEIEGDNRWHYRTLFSFQRNPRQKLHSLMALALTIRRISSFEYYVKNIVIIQIDVSVLALSSIQ